MKRVSLLNCPVDLADIYTALNAANEAIVQNRTFHIVTINPEMIMYAQKNSEFLKIVNNSDLNIPDGIGVKIALKLRAINCKNIRGIDFARKLIGYANEKGYKVALIGAKKEVIDKACENLKHDYPKLDITYKRNGYFNNDEEVIDEIKASNPKIILAGLGSPRQEEFILKLKNVLKGCILIGVGGSFDVLSGYVKEAPMIYRKLGLEWLYRTVSQPERFKRIFPTLPIFLLKCIIKK